MEQAEAANDWDNAIHARMVCGMVAIRAGKAEAARPLLERALLLARHYRLRARERDTLLLLSETCHLLTDWRCAYDFMVAYHHLERTLHDEHVDRQIALLSDQVQIEQLNHESQTQRQQFLALLHDHELVLQSRQAFRLRANQDPLTGLANRAGFQSRGEELLSHPEQVRCAVIFLDLDGFKPVNDTYGHAAGDQVLIHVAERLKAHVRPDDLVARLGGDEFAILLTHLQQPNDALTIATNLLDAVSQPYDLTDTVASGLTVMISASVGVAVAPLSGQTLATLQRQADEAMYAAKRQGRQQIIVDAPSS
ncbi:GGDEF domain-containing protein (plasmid) [Deinococcus sp. KNUC1210]|uniref:GGDEF domain-containing protein n=1 Tax=Deinococcus sp. KNUC1210 TaxID=2917691 RepID=UPI001EF09D8E|nr:GGDEF domain-containing protein [Deinococcus sp. KNUC1210]ULH18031.1 GGDEF domain-containing protein [Deinococcus sp. KNUC1210]